MIDVSLTSWARSSSVDRWQWPWLSGEERTAEVILQVKWMENQEHGGYVHYFSMNFATLIIELQTLNSESRSFFFFFFFLNFHRSLLLHGETGTFTHCQTSAARKRTYLKSRRFAHHWMLRPWKSLLSLISDHLTCCWTVDLMSKRGQLGTVPSEPNFSRRRVTKYEMSHLSWCDRAVFSLMN